MALKLVNIGTSVNSKDGDVLRTAFDKINQNFTELYNSTGGNADTGDYVFNGGNLYNPVGAVDIWSGPFAGPYNGELYLDANGVLLLSNNERNQWHYIYCYVRY
jgi:predicted metalloprotease